MTKAIIFDCFGVLTSDIWKEFVNSLPEDQQEPARELNRSHDRGDMSLQEFSRAIFELTGSQPRVVEAIINSDMEKNEMLIGYIKSLKQNYKTAILSNVSSNWIRNSFLNNDEQKLFDEYVLSYEVRMAKPDAEIFVLTAQRLGVACDECVFVDDGEQNCIAASKVGMKSILYVDFESFTAELEKILANSN